MSRKYLFKYIRNNIYIMEHQDWESIIIKAKHKDGTGYTDTKTQEDQQKVNFNNFEKKFEKNIENGTMKTVKVDKNKSLSIQQKRLAKGLTQKDLANKINVPIKTINEIESGKAKNNPQIINRINRILNN